MCARRVERVRHVCAFGIFDPAYSRNKILLEGLRAHGIKVTECTVDPKTYPRFGKYRVLAQKFWALPREEFDCVYVLFPGSTVVWLARLLFRGLVVYDAFISFYDSNVFDRAQCSPRSMRARWNKFLDWSSTKLAHVCTFDTAEHIRLFQELYRVPPRKCIRVFIGADTALFKHHRTVPAVPRVPGTFLVHFHGSFVPLQGIPYILDAIIHLKDEPGVSFRIVGGDECTIAEYKQVLEEAGALHKVEFTGRVLSTDVPKYIAAADVTLGIFGDTKKAQRVIPNKMFECCTMAKAVITADTPAVREAFTDGKNALLCRHADGADLAHVILRAKGDPGLTERIGEASYALMQERMAPAHLIDELLNELVQRRYVTNR